MEKKRKQTTSIAPRTCVNFAVGVIARAVGVIATYVMQTAWTARQTCVNFAVRVIARAVGFIATNVMCMKIESLETGNRSGKSALGTKGKGKGYATKGKGDATKGKGDATSGKGKSDATKGSRRFVEQTLR